MDEFSFDPKSWGKQPPPADGAVKPAIDRDRKTPESLPEAWRKVATDFQPGPPAPPPPNTGPPVDALDAAPSGGRSYLPLLTAGLSAALLVGGGTWAWLTRAEPKAAAAVAVARPAAVQAVATAPATAAQDVVQRSFNLSGAGELESALVAVGVSQEEAAAASGAAAPALLGKGVIRARLVLQPVGDGYALQQLEATYLDGSGASVKRGLGGQFALEKMGAALNRDIKVLRGELDSESFYTSAVSAGVLDTLIPEFINAFSYDFNLASEVSPGDTFQVAYEETVNNDGEPVGQPKLLFAQLTTKVKSLALYRFVGEDGKVAWYDGNGAITQRGFMRTPVDGARITSKFGMRFHPVLHYTRLHAGVDFGVPVGTPVYAAAAGVVIGSTPTRCGGNMAVVQHDNGWVTRYFHLSRFAPGLHNGQRVEQGFTLGLSGTTGTCTTGPHLHYEVRINGEPVDPMSIKTDDAKRKRLDGTQLAAFMRERDRVDDARARQQY